MDAFTELCIEMLSPLGPVRVRRMFGGQGVYVDGLFVAIIDDGQLFLKSDDVNRARFDAAGCAHFTFPKDGEDVITSYRRPPEEALESPPLMLPWARLALEAALRAANAKAAEAAAVAARKAERLRAASARKKAATQKKTAARTRRT